VEEMRFSTLYTTLHKYLIEVFFSVHFQSLLHPGKRGKKRKERKKKKRRIKGKRKKKKKKKKKES
jgi:protein-arginine kinase activator protein McsA